MIVRTDIPPGQPLGGGTPEYVGWRDAATGRELARTDQPLAAINTGAMVEPYYDGRMYYPAQSGEMIELEVKPLE